MRAMLDMGAAGPVGILLVQSRIERCFVATGTFANHVAHCGSVHIDVLLSSRLRELGEYACELLIGKELRAERAHARARTRQAALGVMPDACRVVGVRALEHVVSIALEADGARLNRWRWTSF